MCKLLSVKKLWTMPYHPQMDGLVEKSHQTIMQMIGKLEEDEKANWPGHLAEIVHAYNATQSTVMGYIPCYLMFGCRPRLPVDFYFPTLRSTEVPRQGASAPHVDKYIATVWLFEDCSSKGPSPVLWQRLRDRSWYYDWKIGTIGLKPGDHHPSQGKTPFKGRGRSRTEGRTSLMSSKSDHNRDPLIWSERPAWTFTCPTLQLVPPHCIRSGCSFVHRCPPSMGQITSPSPFKPTPRGSDKQDNATRRWWPGNHPASG